MLVNIYILLAAILCKAEVHISYINTLKYKAIHD